MRQKICLAIVLATLLLGLVVPTTVHAVNPQVHITVSAFVVGMPGGFTLTYVNDNRIDIEWTMGASSNTTMVRAAYGHVPGNISDGYQVYLGNGTTCSDTAVDLATPSVVYYRAWSQNAAGVWGSLFASGNTERFMSLSFLFFGLVAMAGFLTYFARYTAQLLVRFAAALIWLALGIFLLTGNATNLNISDNWVKVLGFVFIIMVIVPFTWQMRTDVSHERSVRGAPGYPGAATESWREWGPNPRNKHMTRNEASLSRQAEYKEELKGISKRAAKRRRGY